MFSIGLKRMIASLLAAALLSSQLLASLPGLCGCLKPDAVDEVESCCGEPMSADSNIPQCCASTSEGNSCCCDDECDKTLSNCICGYGKSNGKETPNRGNDRLRIGYDAVSELASPSLHLILQDSCAYSRSLDSPGIHRVSPQILLCVWQI